MKGCLVGQISFIFSCGVFIFHLRVFTKFVNLFYGCGRKHYSVAKPRRTVKIFIMSLFECSVSSPSFKCDANVVDNS